MACGCKGTTTVAETYRVEYQQPDGTTVRQVFTSQIDAEMSAARNGGTWVKQ